MTSESTDLTPTRMLFLGDAALTDGFQLIGFETWPDPSAQQLEQVIGELLNSRTNAFVILDCRLAEKNARILEQGEDRGRTYRRHGGAAPQRTRPFSIVRSTSRSRACSDRNRLADEAG